MANKRYIRDPDNEMTIVTINLPGKDLRYIKKLLSEGIVPSRSEYVRNAVRNQINADLEVQKFKDAILEDKIKLDPKKFVRIPGYNGNEPVKIVRRLEY